MKELFEKAKQLFKDWSDRKISDFDLITQQAELIQKIEYMWHNSPASEFYNKKM